MSCDGSRLCPFERLNGARSVAEDDGLYEF